MMKIASRWAEAEVVKSSTKKTEKEGEKDSAVKSFESEQSSLFKEMTEVDTKVLKNVGARSVPVETYNNFVLESEGLAEDKTGEEVLANNEENSVKDENVVYMASAQLGLSRVEGNP